jgi:hypothetical protein
MSKCGNEIEVFDYTHKFNDDVGGKISDAQIILNTLSDALEDRLDEHIDEEKRYSQVHRVHRVLKIVDKILDDARLELQEMPFRHPCAY